MNKYLMEFIGTFFLVLAVGVAVPNAGNLAPLAIGAILISMIYAGGHISGANYNPAVTVGLLVRGGLPKVDIAPYIGAQITGGLVATLVALILTGKQAAPAPIEFVPVVIAEFLFTFALVFVVLNVATSKETNGNDYYGVAIGLVVICGAYTVGHISGAVFNPAVAIGAALMNLLDWMNLWLYLTAQVTGGILAGLLFLLLNPDDH